MAAYLKITDIKGASTDAGHIDWIRIDSITTPIVRSIPQGAVDQQRARGETNLQDISIVKQCDKSTTKLAAACASGKFIPEVTIDLCTTVNNKAIPYYTIVLKNVILTNYSFSATADGSSLPTDTIGLGYTAITWNYIVIDPKTGANQGNVPANFDLGATTAS